MSNQIFQVPTSGSYEKGCFYSSITRVDGFSSGVTLRRDFGSLRLIAQNKAIETARTIEELLKIPGAMTSAAFLDMVR